MKITTEQIESLTVSDVQSDFKGWKSLGMSPKLSEYYHDEWVALAHLSHAKNVIYYDLISGGKPHFNENCRCYAEFGKAKHYDFPEGRQLDADTVANQLTNWLKENLMSHGLPEDAAIYVTQTIFAEGRFVWFTGAVVANFTYEKDGQASFDDIKRKCIDHIKTLQSAVNPVVTQTDVITKGAIGTYATVLSSNGFHSRKFVGKRGHSVGKLTSAGLRWVLRFSSESAINEEGLFSDDELEWEKT